MTSEVPLYVVDASVATKWYLHDEDYVDRALQVLNDYQEGRIALATRDHILYEIPSSIAVAASRKRLDPDLAGSQIRHFLDLNLPTARLAVSRSMKLLIPRAFRQALTFKISFYDSVYVALAQALDCPFIDADDLLRFALLGKFPGQHWIQNYSSP